MSAKVTPYKPPAKLVFKTGLSEYTLSRILRKSTHRSYEQYVYTNVSPEAINGFPAPNLGKELPLKREDIDRLSHCDYCTLSYDEGSTQ